MKHPLNENLRTQVRILPAKHGDSIIVKTFDSQANEFNIVIDGGPPGTFEEVLHRELRGILMINIIVLTHIDNDHIGGLIKFVKNALFNPSQVERYWFNSKNIQITSTSDNIHAGHAKTFEELLIDKGNIKDKWEEDIIVGVEPKMPEGISVEIVSPSQEILEQLYLNWPSLSEEYLEKLQDLNISAIQPSQIQRGTLQDLALADDTPANQILKDIFNSSSIAFVFRTFDTSFLFLGDAHPIFMEETLTAKGYSADNKLKVDFVKISHHGSKNNTTNKLLDMIDCDKFIISTNGGSSSHTHPDRETIARIIHHPERVKSNYANKRTVYLNYPLESIAAKAGQFVHGEDFKVGNWELIENKCILENE
ncbi:MBL fold metallo-hydrolase [Sphingobacterium sp. JUb56]|uniref:ComEC/Rec2 family competence protein n=1 Tax=Sphingobacterium sp. JUb56 TaxID=2587145 RepID=UPI001610C342|nr:MBL fold metallo-hydrolase [Sphingobacterium sp. JUb56]MBB2951178.1 beta-lactamase superfamily II metal-dependent hydrolase [Sphingobacterium sp. JUb56]